MGADLNTVLYKILLPAYAGMIRGNVAISELE